MAAAEMVLLMHKERPYGERVHPAARAILNRVSGVDRYQS